jgi:sec-independent protein translocase protein TatA
MDIGWPEILIIALVILVLFGSKKLPDAARSLGRSMRILKTEVKGLHDDDQASSSTSTSQTEPTPALPPAPPATAPDTTQSAAPVADQHESR